MPKNAKIRAILNAESQGCKDAKRSLQMGVCFFATKEHKEHKDKNLSSSFFVFFAIFRGNSTLVAASAALRPGVSAPLR
jgi:hypothetical protein